MKRNGTKLKTALVWLAYLVCLSLSGLAASGICTSKLAVNNVVMPSIGIALAAVMVALAVVNAVERRKLRKKFADAQNIAEAYEDFVKSYKNAEDDYLAEEKSVLKYKNRIVACAVLCSLLSFAVMCCTAFGCTEGNVLLSVSFIFVCAFGALWPTFVLNLVSAGAQFYPERKDELKPQEYPLLYDAVRSVAEKSECNAHIGLYLSWDNSVSVASGENGINIQLNAVETALLTKDELHQVLLHEVAHAVNSDTKLRLKLERFSYKLDAGTFNGAWRILFGALCERFYLKKETYYLACTKFYEQNADKAVEKYGNPQTYINATAKSMMLSMYGNDFVPERDFDVFASPKIPTDYYFKYLEDFREKLKTDRGAWEYLLAHRIPSRQDTHPTFNMRKEALGVETYDVDTEETSQEYVAEQKKLLEQACKRLCAETKGEFEQEGREFYKEVKEKVDKFSFVEEFASMQDKILALRPLFACDREKCLAVAEDILAERPQCAHANYYKGVILASKLDAGCVECLYKAADGGFNIPSAVNFIGEFACNTGNEKLLREYREKSTAYMVKAYAEEFTLTPRIKITPNSLPKEDFDRILQYIVEVGKDALQRVYSVTTQDKKFTTYLLVWQRQTTYMQYQRVSGDIFEYLDAYAEIFQNGLDFSLMSGTVGKAAKKIIRLDGALIYDCNHKKLSKNG